MTTWCGLSYRVCVLLCLAMSSSAVWAADGLNIKKKVVFAQFSVAEARQVEDFSNIYDQLPEVLAQRLARGGQFLAMRSPLSIPPFVTENQHAELVKQIAASVGAQFVVFGQLKNADIQLYPGRWISEIGQVEGRKFELELALYDGYLGKLINLIPIRAETSGQIRSKRTWALDSESFLQTDYGQIVDQALNKLTESLGQQLAAEPFRAKIIRIDHGVIYLDAGQETGLAVGNKLIVYQRENKELVQDLASNTLGVNYKELDTLEITQLEPQFSVGKLSDAHIVPDLVLGAYAQVNPQRLAEIRAKHQEQEQQRLAAEELEKQRLAAEQEALKEKWQQMALMQEQARREQREREEAQALAEERAKAEALRKKEEQALARKAAAEAARHKGKVPNKRYATYQEVLAARAKANGAAGSNAVNKPKVYSLPAKDLKDLPSKIQEAGGK